MVNSSNIPEALKQQNQWLLWRKEERKGKPTKVPYSVHGGMGKSNTPATWGTFEQCLNRSSSFDGVGFVFADGDGLVGIDLDKCMDSFGTVSDEAKEILMKFRDKAFVELSPSGKGFHIYCLGIAQHCGKGQGDKSWVEVYDSRSPRYFTVTGNAYFGQCEPQNCQDELEWLHEKWTKRAEKKKAPARKPQPVSLDDSEILLKARQKSDFDRLFSVGASASDDHSSMDLALCNSLAFWFGCDPHRMDRVFRSSALMRDKWDRNAGNNQTYGDRTIDRAIRDCSDTYTPNFRVNNEPRGRQQGSETPEGNYFCGYSDYELCEGIDDEARAQVVYKLHGSQFLCTYNYGWMFYTGTHWATRGAEAKLHRVIVDAIKERRAAALRINNETIVKACKPSTKNVRAAKFLFESMVTVDIDTFDQDKDKLNVKNGVVDLRTGQLEKHSREQLFTYCINTEYKPEASCEEWMHFLGEITTSENCDTQEMIDYIQQAIGYSITGHATEDILFYILGPTRSGKGTFTETIMRLIGKPLSTEVDFQSFSSTRENDANNFDLAPLKPSRLIFASESSKYKPLNEAKIKQLTGGNEIRCSFKGKTHFEYTPQYCIWLSSNFAPNADVDDEALWGRLRVINFPNSRLGKEDKGLKRRLRSETSLEGVLNWAVDGAIKWYTLRDTGLETPKSIEKATKQIRTEQDTINMWIEDRVELGPDCKHPHTEMYKDYEEWCEQAGDMPKKRKQFCAAMTLRGLVGPKPVKVSGKNIRCWVGAQLCNDF